MCALSLFRFGRLHMDLLNLVTHWSESCQLETSKLGLRASDWRHEGMVFEHVETRRQGLRACEEQEVRPLGMQKPRS